MTQILTKVAPPVGSLGTMYPPEPDLFQLRLGFSQISELVDRRCSRRARIHSSCDELLCALVHVKRDLALDVTSDIVL
jgi:hypothetical protein